MKISKRALFTNPTYNKISSIPISTQVFFWLGYFSFNTIRWGSFYSDYAYSFKSNLIEFPFHIALSYLFIFYLLPKLFNGKIVECFTLLLISLGLTLVLKFQLTYYFTSGDVMPEYAGITPNIDFQYATTVILGEVYVVSFVTAIKLAIDWIKQKEYLNETNEVLLENELKYLRSQIQPHFFFNTLNGRVGRGDGVPIKYEYVDLKQNELYNLKTDPSESTNIIQDFPDIVKQIEHLANKKRQEIGDDLYGITGSEIREVGLIN